jgi:hypothetical protein
MHTVYLIQKYRCIQYLSSTLESLEEQKALCSFAPRKLSTGYRDRYATFHASGLTHAFESMLHNQMTLLNNTVTRARTEAELEIILYCC